MPASLRRGSKLGKYVLDRRVGSGSFATVWRARDSVERRTVALKIAHPDVIAEWGRHSVEHEARIASQLDHPNIVSVRNADWIDGRFVMATDIAQKSLAESPGIRRSGPMALQVVRDVAAGLAYAHGKRVLHRDVKPENILIFPDRHAALTDFGVSRFALPGTRSYTEAGTLGYMAPEQAYGRARLGSDVFSIGLIAYELLTGHLPTWPFEWPPAKGWARFQERVPEPVRGVLRRAAEFEPSQRWTDAVEFHKALERAFAKAAPPKAPRRPRRRKRPTPAPSALSVEAELFRKRHGAALAMRYRCHRCDGPIAEEMSHCPWCGTADNSFRDITRRALYCPDCERGIDAEWTACPWCYTGRFDGNGRPPRRDPKAERRCTKPGCSGQLRAFMRYCPICKQKPRRLWSHPDLSDRCPRCRWPVSRAHWRYCPWCARREPRAGTFGAGKRGR